MAFFSSDSPVLDTSSAISSANYSTSPHASREVGHHYMCLSVILKNPLVCLFACWYYSHFIPGFFFLYLFFLLFWHGVFFQAN